MLDFVGLAENNSASLLPNYIVSQTTSSNNFTCPVANPVVTSKQNFKQYIYYMILIKHSVLRFFFLTYYTDKKINGLFRFKNYFIMCI